MDREELNRLSGEILDAAICVHKEMGPGLLESVYEECLAMELTLRGHLVERHVTVPLIYKGHLLKKEYEMDLLGEMSTIKLCASAVKLPFASEASPSRESQLRIPKPVHL